MSNRKLNKERERCQIEVFKSIYKEFPNGEISGDEDQERPDFIVINNSSKIGIEITCLQDQKLRKAESECERAVAEACRIYEKMKLPPLHVGVHMGDSNNLNKRTRKKFATALANLIATSIPPENDLTELKNDWIDIENFPHEIDAILIGHYSSLTRNYWSAPSAGFFRKDFTDDLQKIISDKSAKLSGYSRECDEQWLLIVTENSGPSTFYEASSATLNHKYVSSFEKVFLLELFHRKLLDLKLTLLNGSPNQQADYPSTAASVSPQR